MTEDIYKKLRHQLDQYSMGFPEAPSGIEMEILHYLFTKEEAQMFTCLSPMLETADSVATRLGRDPGDVESELASMAEKGLVFRLKKGDTAKYGAIPFVHGLFEFQVKKLSKEFVEMVDKYFDEAFDKNMQDNAALFLHPVPVGKSLDVRHQVASYDDAVEILKSKPKIVVTDCICRKAAETQKKDCGKPMEACFMFGSMGQYYLDRKMGREISLDEAVAIMDKCREEGLVTQPATSQNPSGMCNCCGDCCGVLRALNKHPRPADMVLANHFAQVDPDACTGCETCTERCQTGAISMNGDEVAQVNQERCIGCGLCVVTCPGDAISLVEKPEDQRQVPPETMAQTMIELAKKRGVI